LEKFARKKFKNYKKVALKDYLKKVQIENA